MGGLLSGSPALLSEAAHSVAESVNEVFLLTAPRRSRRPGGYAAGLIHDPAHDSEEVERVCVRIRTTMERTWPTADHVFPDITNAPPRGGVWVRHRMLRESRREIRLVLVGGTGEAVPRNP